jgi:hypothetical protein
MLAFAPVQQVLCMLDALGDHIGIADDTDSLSIGHGPLQNKAINPLAFCVLLARVLDAILRHIPVSLGHSLPDKDQKRAVSGP